MCTPFHEGEEASGDARQTVFKDIFARGITHELPRIWVLLIQGWRVLLIRLYADRPNTFNEDVVVVLGRHGRLLYDE